MGFSVGGRTPPVRGRSQDEHSGLRGGSMVGAMRGQTGGRRWAWILALLLSAGTAAAGPGDSVLVRSEAGPIRVVTVATGLDTPWALAFLPDGRMGVTERPGQMRLIGSDGKVSAPLAGVPKVH